jgi:RNA polymerase sigma-70 factor (ECF subfamily)
VDSDPDVSLMLRVQKDDADAFEEILQKYERPIARLVQRYLGPRVDVEGLTQEVFLRVWRARASWKPQPTYRSWLYRIATNLCLNEMRRKKGAVSLDALAEAGGEAATPPSKEERPTAALEKKELSLVIQEILAGLPESQRLAVVLNKYQGLSYEEIGEVMNLSIPAVKSLLSRAREGIRERILPYVVGGKGQWQGI